MNKIDSAPKHVRIAYVLMINGHSTREMAKDLGVSLKTAGKYRNKVNRLVPAWEMARAKEDVISGRTASPERSDTPKKL